MLVLGSVAASGCSGDDETAQTTNNASTTIEVSTAPTTIAAPAGSDRLVVNGSAALDGAPFDSQFLGAVVRRDGLITPCQAEIPPILGGRYEIRVLGDAEGSGCGVPGAQVLLWTFANETKLYSTSAATWPEQGNTASFDVQFATATPNGDAPAVSELSGEVFDRDGHQLPPGTLVEAYVGTTRCGVASVRRAGEDFTGYVLAVVGPDSIEGCTRDAPITFLIDGQPANETSVNHLNGGAAGSGGSFPLTQS